MPEFSQPFAGNNIDRTMSHNELIRAIRYTIAAEYEAIQLYLQMADATDNELAREVLPPAHRTGPEREGVLPAGRQRGRRRDRETAGEGVMPDGFRTC